MCGCCVQWMSVAVLTTTSRTTSSTHTPRANTSSPGASTGSVPAALATMPVPITEANQLGPMNPNAG